MRTRNLSLLAAYARLLVKARVIRPKVRYEGGCHIASTPDESCTTKPSEPGQTHIIMGKNQLLPHALATPILLSEPLAIAIHHFTEHRPFHSTDQTSLLQSLSLRTCFPLLAEYLVIYPGDHFFTSGYPFIPISPDERTSIPFFIKQINSIMQLSHTLSNLLRSLGNS